MKVIDLLNKIANGEELPRKIQVYNSKYRLLDNRTYHSIDHDGRLGQNFSLDGMLNEDVKIIEDTSKEDITRVVAYKDEEGNWRTPKEDEEIEKIEERIDTGLVGTEILDEFKVASAINKQASYTFDIAKKINEIIDRLNGEEL